MKTKSHLKINPFLSFFSFMNKLKASEDQFDNGWTLDGIQKIPELEFLKKIANKIQQSIIKDYLEKDVKSLFT